MWCPSAQSNKNKDEDAPNGEIEDRSKERFEKLTLQFVAPTYKFNLQ